MKHTQNIIKGLMLILIMVIFVMVSCLVVDKFITNSNAGEHCEVKLQSIKPYTLEKRNAIDISETQEENESEDINYQYVLLENGSKEFSVVITLDNKNDYHILDFNLTCDDLSLYILIDDSYVLLTDLSSINWSGDTNSKSVLKFKSEDNDFINTLKLTKLFYINRNKEIVNADVSTNNEIDIYRVEQVKLELKGINANGLVFEPNFEDYVLCNGNEFTTKEEEIELTYQYQLNDNLAVDEVATISTYAYLYSLFGIEFDEKNNKVTIDLSKAKEYLVEDNEIQVIDNGETKTLSSEENTYIANSTKFTIKIVINGLTIEIVANVFTYSIEIK